MEENEETGFDYYLSEETILEYQKKPLELRLEWLYMGNLFRKEYPESIINTQDRFRRDLNE